MPSPGAILERLLGLVSLSVMGIENLNTAARAAGFAMASADEEAGPEIKVEARSETDASLLDLERDPAAKPEASSGDWFKSLFGVFGRGAPA